MLSKEFVQKKEQNKRRKKPSSEDIKNTYRRASSCSLCNLEVISTAQAEAEEAAADDEHEDGTQDKAKDSDHHVHTRAQHRPRMYTSHHKSSPQHSFTSQSMNPHRIFRKKSLHKILTKKNMLKTAWNKY